MPKIVNGLKWLGLDYDGPIVSQFENTPRHAAVANELLAAGKAYHCYCTPEELDAMRARAKAEGSPTFYDRRWRDSIQPPPAGVKPVIRIKAPLTGESTVHDQVQGDVTVPNAQLDDFIILRSDGTPTYMLAVVVDDHDMGVTHVIRGDDHLNNTFRQNVIYDGMGWPKPVYAHLPLILGPDGAKLSKRHGATSVEDYQAMGYLPEAMRNYLLRLGWSHGDEEIISDAQAVAWFDLDHIGRSPARFDFAKLEHLNAHYIKQADNARLIELCTPLYAARHNVIVDTAMHGQLLACMDELKHRAKTLVQIVDESAFFGKPHPIQPDAKAAEILNTPESAAILAALAEAFKTLDPFTAETIQSTCKHIADQLTGGKLGKIGMPFTRGVDGNDRVAKRVSCGGDFGEGQNFGYFIIRHA